MDTKSSQHPNTRRAAALGLLLLASLTSVLIYATVAAPTAAQQNVSRVVFTLDPGGTVRVPVRFWCLDYGKPFPTEIMGPTGQTTPTIVAALEAAEAQDVAIGDALQVQLALWRLVGGQFVDVPGQDHALAQALVTAATGAQAGPVPVLGNPGLSALQVSVDGFQPAKDPGPGGMGPFYGGGTLVVRNTGAGTVTFTITGAIFSPREGQAGQTVVVQHQAIWPSVIEGGSSEAVLVPTPSAVTSQGVSPVKTPASSSSPVRTPTAPVSPVATP